MPFIACVTTPSGTGVELRKGWMRPPASVSIPGIVHAHGLRRGYFGHALRHHEDGLFRARSLYPVRLQPGVSDDGMRRFSSRERLASNPAPYVMRLPRSRSMPHLPRVFLICGLALA